nr:receptor tyrosine kinase FGFR3A2 [Carcinus maenas]
MIVRGPAGLLVLPLAALLAATGVCRGGAARFYTTNTLTEAEPRLGGDYDALLDQMSGDFGVRSEVLEAAGQEPEYRGSDTMVVPLYIPKGAVPIKVARIARSDSRDPVLEVVDLTMSPAADSVLIRRIGPVDRRRGAPPPNRAAWRSPQRTRITRLTPVRRSDSPRRRVSSSHTPPLSSSSSSSARVLPTLQSEFGKRLHLSQTDSPNPPSQSDTDTATKRAKKNELSKDSQFPDELHTTTLPTTTTTTAAAPTTTTATSTSPTPIENRVKATTRRFSTHLTSSTSTTTTTAATTTATDSTSTTTESPSTTTASSTTSTTTTPTTPTTTTTQPPSSTTEKKVPTTTTTTPPTTTTTSPTTQKASHTPSSTSSTTERRSIIFPRPVERVLNSRDKDTTPPTTTTTTITTTATPSTTTTTTTPSTTTTTTPSTTTLKAVTSGRSFPVPVRNLPAWVTRPRTSPPQSPPPPLPPRRLSTITPTTTTTTTPTERPRRIRDKLRRLSRLRGGVDKEVVSTTTTSTTTTTTTTTTTERSQSTTPTTTTSKRTLGTTSRPSTTTRRTSTVRKMPSVSEILKSRTEEEEENLKEEEEEKEVLKEVDSASETTIGRPSTTEAYVKSTTSRSEQDSTTQRILKEAERSQLHVATETSSVEHKTPSGTSRKFVRRPRPQQDSGTPEGVRPSAPRRRRPLRPRIKLPLPITYHRAPTTPQETVASTTPPQETFASTSTTTTTTTTQRPRTTTITVTSPTTPRVVLTTTTTTTTTAPPTTTTVRTPAQVVIDSLTEIMKDATNTSRSKDKVYNITANLESLNRRLAEQGIHIIHAEVDGVKIKLDNRMIIRPRPPPPPVTTFRPSTSLASTLPSPRPSGPSFPSSPSTSFSFFTPASDSDVQNKEIHTSIRSSFSFHTSHSPDTANEVQTTTRVTLPTTNKPVEARKPDNPFLAPSRLPTALEGEEHPPRNRSDTRAPQSPSVSITGTRSGLNLEDHERAPTSILATATVPATVTTRTRSTTVPITTHHAATTPSLRLHPVTTSTHDGGEESKLHNDFGAPTTVHPTSHHRPTFFPPPTDHSHADNIPRPTRIPTIQVISILKDNELPGSPATVEDAEGDLNDSQDLRNTPRASYTAIYVISIIGVIPAAGLAFFIARRFLKKTQKALPESEERGEGFTPITHHHSRKTQSSAHATTMDGESPSSVEAKNPRFTPWEFPRSKLRLASILGQGNFGVVWKAEARDLCACEGSQGGPTVLVAVKGVKEGAGQKEKQDLLKELGIMQHLGHNDNVVTLLGCCTQQEPYFVIMEYVMFGKLLTFLRDHRTRQNYYNFSSDTAALTSHDLTRFACQVASGCEYIQSRGIIHRDLASRNILVDHNKVCKIADFGLARSVKDLGSDIYEQKSRGALPIRWMAPESLYMSIFTHKSDVWSLGILCWEIVTLGSTPYPGMTAREVMRRVREGYRLERPEHCHQELYHIVTRCWHQDLNQRPSFAEIKEDLQELLDNSPTGYIDLENFPESSYYSMHENTDEEKL